MITDPMYRRFIGGGLKTERGLKVDRANPNSGFVSLEIASRTEKLEDEIQSLRRIIHELVQERD